MTTPPNRNADAADDAAEESAAPSRSHPEAHDANEADARARATHAGRLRAMLAGRLRTPLVFFVCFAALVALHATLLDLPYYWDEAGYFIPAARDIYADGSFVPHSTLSNAHPPLVMAYLALAWKLFGFKIVVARVAMLAVSALALAGVFCLAERVQNARVAVAAVVCTALYPVFFAQSSLAHLDMAAAALTIWALVFYLPARPRATTLHDDATPSQKAERALQGRATSLRSDATTLQGAKTSLRDAETPLHGDATPLQGGVSSLHDGVSSLHDGVSPLQEGVSSLHPGVSSLHLGVSSLQDDVSSLQDGVSSLHHGVSPLQGGVTALRGDVTTLRDDATALRRRAACVALLALAALAKETALLVPLTLCAWELLTCHFFRGKSRALTCVEQGGSVKRPLALLLACVPLALWFAYHRSQTDYTFGNPEYFRYNVESTVNLSRILEAGWGRLKHVTFHMNLWVLTLAGLAAMLLKPRRDRVPGRALARERERIGLPEQFLFLVLVAAHVVALSVVGGAVLARYMLPVLPLVILVWVSTLWRRVPAWPLAAALVCAAFAYRCEVNPSYSFPWEENLAYRDFVLLQRDAARFLSENYPDARVLTSWPATDELRNPYFGYTPRALAVVPVESLKREDVERAAAQGTQYDAALLYSTHGGLSLEEAARILGARVVFREERKGQWAAVVEVGSQYPPR
jgi:X-X-X-Leu-X-X-Gly heptad repeat protein